MRTFSTGATRDDDADKLDFEGFLSPLVLLEFAQYMHRHRKQSDGKLRDSDNWQKGIPLPAYMKSLWRHFFAVWSKYRRGEDMKEELCAVLFNVQGMLHEVLKNESDTQGGEPGAVPMRVRGPVDGAAGESKEWEHQALPLVRTQAVGESP